MLSLIPSRLPAILAHAQTNSLVEEKGITFKQRGGFPKMSLVEPGLFANDFDHTVYRPAIFTLSSANTK